MELKVCNRIVLVDEASWQQVFEVEMPTQGLVFRSRPCDVRWRIKTRTHTEYVIATVRGVFEVQLHRLITSANRGQVVDHINGNGLDNRTENLRIVTQQQNSFNRRGQNGKVVGVSQMQSGKWESYVRQDGKKLHLGCFKTSQMAIAARDEWVKQHRGEYAYTNGS